MTNEEKIASMTEKINTVQSDIAEIKLNLKEHVKWEQKYHQEDIKQRGEDLLHINDQFMKLEYKLDKKYAPRWTEWAVKTLIGTTITGFVTVIIYIFAH